jgi:hypothetical protein
MLLRRDIRNGIRMSREIVHFVIDALQNSRAIPVPVRATFPKGGRMDRVTGTERERAPVLPPRRAAPRH